MNLTNDHARAQQIVALRLTGDIGAGERAFLETHLAACPACTTAAAAMEQGLAALRSVSVRSEPALVASTQRRVREQALHLREEQGRRAGLVLSSMLVAVLTGLTGLSMWRMLEWAGGLAVAPSVWAPVLLSLWFVPGVLAGVAVWAAGAAPERRSALTS